MNPQNKAGRSWFTVNARAARGEAEVMIYDEIGAYGVTAKAFVAAIKEIEAATINVRINSVGGDAFEATAIYNALREHDADIVVHIDGVAASAASVIAMAGDDIRMADNAYVMIHDAWGGAIGTAADMEKYSEMLEKVSGNIAEIYAKRAGGDAKQWRRKMLDETWYTAEEAKDAGLVESVIADQHAEPAKAHGNFKIYNRIPDPLKRAWGIDTVSNSTPTVVGDQASRDAAAQATSKDVPMKAEDFTAFAAANPDAAEVKSVIAKGAKPFKAEGVTDERNRVLAILDAHGLKDHPATACITAGDEPETAKRIADVAAAARTEVQAKAQAALDAANKEIDRLKSLAETGGHPGVGAGASNKSSGDAPDGSDPKALAEWEFDNNKATFKASTKERYVNSRVDELTGALRIARA